MYGTKLSVIKECSRIAKASKHLSAEFKLKVKSAYDSLKLSEAGILDYVTGKLKTLAPEAIEDFFAKISEHLQDSSHRGLVLEELKQRILEKSSLFWVAIRHLNITPEHQVVLTYEFFKIIDKTSSEYRDFVQDLTGSTAKSLEALALYAATYKAGSVS